MRYDRLIIDNYGAFSGTTVDFSNGNFHLLYGPNEGGKSTLLGFMRAALFGLAKTRGESAVYAPGSSTAGGSVEFTLRDGRSGVVARAWDVAEQRDAGFFAKLDGAELGETDFGALLGVERDFFTNFSGISYRELATGENLLNSTNLSRLIYGLSFGDADRVTKAMKLLDARLGALLKRGNGKGTLNLACDRLSAACSANAGAKAAGYAKLNQEIGEEERRKKALDMEIAGVDKTISDCERLVNARELYDAYLVHAGSMTEFLERAEAEYDAETLHAFSEKDDEKYRTEKDCAANLRDKIEEKQTALEREKAVRNSLETKRNLRYAGMKSRVEELWRQMSKFSDGEDDIRRKTNELHIHDGELITALAETGFASHAPTEEEIRACRKVLPDSVIENARAGKTEEGAAAEATSLNGRLLDDARADLNTAESVLAEARKRFDDEVAPVGNIDAAESVNGKFLAAKRSHEELGKTLTKLSLEELEEERLANDLVANATRNGLTLGSDACDAFLTRCERLADPCAFEKLSKGYDALDKRLKEIDADRRHIAADIAGYESELADNGLEDAVAGVDARLEEKLRLRDSLWIQTRALALGGETRAYDDALKLTNEYETAIKDVDRLMDERLANAESRGAYETISRKIRSTRRKLDELTALYNEVNAERLKTLENARELLRRCGFDFCGDWSLDVIAGWHGLWLKFREKREKKALAAQELYEQAGKVADDFRFVVREAQAWGVDVFAEAKIPDSIDSNDDVRMVLEALRPTEAIQTLLSAKIKKYKERLAEVEKAEESVCTAREKVRKYKREAKRLEGERAALDERLRRFMADLNVPCANPDGFRWGSLIDALEKLQNWQNDAQKQSRAYDALEEQRERFNKFLGEVRAVAGELGDADDAAERFETLIERWHDAVDKACDVENNIDAVEQRIEALEPELVALGAELTLHEGRMAEIENLVGVERRRFEEFQSVAADFRRLRQERDKARDILAASLAVSAGSDSFNADLETLANKDKETRRRELEEARDERKDLQSKYNECNAKLGELNKSMKDLENSGGALDVAAEYQSALGTLRAAVNEYIPVKLAAEALNRSLNAFESDKIPQVLEDASGFFNRLTNGVYERIEKSAPDVSGKGKGKAGSAKKDSGADAADEAFNSGANAGYWVHMPAKNGMTKRLDVDRLSVGTREQLYLAIRLALLGEYNANPAFETLPILGDDILVQFDETRVRSALEVFKELSETRNCQVILMTHHARTRELFEDVVSAEGVIEL